ncbi:hypothetical protein M8818_006257 [Zalaria obscura]|uniref:Uncharacterized protein n=1 Tax=Zalaria obscura TaxID=2024903 RepID=A0ACC3S7T8_9PEZI
MLSKGSDVSSGPDDAVPSTGGTTGVKSTISDSLSSDEHAYNWIDLGALAPSCEGEEQSQVLLASGLEFDAHQTWSAESDKSCDTMEVIELSDLPGCETLSRPCLAGCTNELPLILCLGVLTPPGTERRSKCVACYKYRSNNLHNKEDPGSGERAEP